jgi:predicted phage tail protein
MNASARLRASNDTDWAALATDLLESIRTDLQSLSAEIAHLKLHMTGDSGQIVGNLTSNDSPLFLRGNLSPSCHRVGLLLNARVHIAPEQLQTLCEGWLQTVAGAHRVAATIFNIQSLQPGRPQPTHRYKNIV